MDNVITVAIITGLCTAVPTVIVSIINSNSNRKLLEYRMNKIEEKVDKLETKLDKNDVAERVAMLEHDNQNSILDIKELRKVFGTR